MSPTTLNSPRAISGVESLNGTLSDVVRRINDLANRIGELANQFGAPPSDAAAAGSAPVKEPNTTNEFMSRIHEALTSLERITSRIDNQ